ncbi:OmpA family protein [Streptomyces otsuchiensis]|uniref:OmpA family protein n=1 Tax=Streptomyces otsuchiensis TaxID=2681388 RepID=UPI00102FF530|nr:OmpA family protein [Streptomyces otsuchiensis]
MSQRPRTSGLALVGVGTGVAMLAFATPAFAQDDEYEQPPGYEQPATPEVDVNAPGLKLGDGATLAEPRVLDIKFVIEEIGGGAESGDGAGSGDASPDPSPDPDPPREEPGGAGVDGGSDTREERTGGQRKFVLQAGVLFQENEADLSDEALEALEAVAEAIDDENPEWVNIFGFTDSQGSYDFGVQLSNLRAENTQLALIDLMDDASGITFNLNGYSEEYFLYDNSTEEGRQKNRRVEISWPTSG